MGQQKRIMKRLTKMPPHHGPETPDPRPARKAWIKETFQKRQTEYMWLTGVAIVAVVILPLLASAILPALNVNSVWAMPFIVVYLALSVAARYGPVIARRHLLQCPNCGKPIPYDRKYGLFMQEREYCPHCRAKLR